MWKKIVWSSCGMNRRNWRTDVAQNCQHHRYVKRFILDADWKTAQLLECWNHCFTEDGWISEVIRSCRSLVDSFIKPRCKVCLCHKSCLSVLWTLETKSVESQTSSKGFETKRQCLTLHQKQRVTLRHCHLTNGKSSLPWKVWHFISKCKQAKR